MATKKEKSRVKIDFTPHIYLYVPAARILLFPHSSSSQPITQTRKQHRTKYVSTYNVLSFINTLSVELTKNKDGENEKGRQKIWSCPKIPPKLFFHHRLLASPSRYIEDVSLHRVYLLILTHFRRRPTWARAVRCIKLQIIRTTSRISAYVARVIREIDILLR